MGAGQSMEVERALDEAPTAQAAAKVLGALEPGALAEALRDQGVRDGPDLLSRLEALPATKDVAPVDNFLDRLRTIRAACVRVEANEASAPRRVPQPIQQRRLAGPVRTAHGHDAELGVDCRDDVGRLGHEPQLPLAFVVDHFDERQRCVRKIWGCFQVRLHIGCIDGGGVEVCHCS